MNLPALQRFPFRLRTAIVISLILHLAVISQIGVRRFSRPGHNVVLTDVEYLPLSHPVGVARKKPKPRPKEIVDLNAKSSNSEFVKPAAPEEEEPDQNGLAENPFESEARLFLPFYAVEEVPVFQNRIMPLYPENAQKLGQSSRVILEAYIDADGKVRFIRVVKSGGEVFDQAAILALKQSVFKPARINNRAVPVRIQVPYIFSLEQ